MSQSSVKDWIHPDWPAPKAVRVVMTTRSGGISQAPFDALNLGDHVDDDLQAVLSNRATVRRELQLPDEPLWLTQVHGITVASVGEAEQAAKADASVAKGVGKVCAIMTADCLPVLFCNTEGTVVAGAHAGWRGLEAGVLESTIQAMDCKVEDILVWMGAAIGPQHFEVGDEVREAFVQSQPAAEQAFRAQGAGKWLADLYALARLRLERFGIASENIYGGTHCTYAQADQFYSYRRESRTGRMAALIWLES